jgi:hypothetical protein
MIAAMFSSWKAACVEALAGVGMERDGIIWPNEPQNLRQCAVMDTI